MFTPARPRRTQHLLAVLFLGCLCLGWPGFSSPSYGAPSVQPRLEFEGPDAMASLMESLADLDQAPYDEMAELLGLDDGGGPIRVRLVAEGSPEVDLVPRWAVAYAIGNASLVVLIPSRVPAYPDSSLETVLHHEVAHVLVARAAGRRPVPRWFNEGVAMVAAREGGSQGWGLGDQSRLLWATIRRDGSQVAKLDQRFAEGPHSAAQAYSLSAAFVRHLLAEYGPRAVEDVLRQVRQGHDFATAFRQATGRSLPQAEDEFWDALDFSHKWIPFLTSSATLWILITLLALWAFRRRRLRDAELLASWKEQEVFETIDLEPSEYRDPTPRHDPWIH